jgi:glyoxylase-like metal-dependent hydrolase (beta-lactamase superfamily II)/rhodanese-related sulfurtransferase
VDLEVLVTSGLGDNSYMLASGGEALVVDPQRDVDRYLDAARAKGAKITAVLETHVHNDYVSGAVELRDATGAEIIGPAAAGYRFPHRGVSEGDEIALGKVRLTAIETPGHTPEHVSYLIYQEGADAPAAVFTGGSLMVGGAGRTDLLGEELTDRLTRDQYRTLRRLSSLPDTVEVLPTHGAGSFCGAAPGRKERTSTVGEERRLNAALAAPDEDAFVRQQLSGLLAYPSYYRHMAPINLAGPRVLRGSFEKPAGLSPDEFERRIEAGAWAVDGRWRVQFARAHVPGSINVELADSFGSYVGWVVPFGQPVVLVLPEPKKDSLAEAVAQLVRIGYERVEGYLASGVEAWRAAGRPVRSYPVAGLEELCRAYRSGRPPQVLDVRQRTEWDAGHIEGSRHLFVGDLPERVGDLPAGADTWVICATGHRASLGASLLDREEIPVRLVDGTGVADFLKHCPP